MKKYICVNSELLAYCLMPNHFHFMLLANEKTVSTVVKAGQERNALSEGVRMLLSSYAQAIDKQENRTGSIFTQNTKAKMLNFGKGNVDYASTCFHYIHQNPLAAGLVDKLEDWKYSSFGEYRRTNGECICNQTIAKEIVNFDEDSFYSLSYAEINEKKLKSIW